MTPDQIALVGSIVAGVREHPEFAARFYERLFVVEPQTAHLFTDVPAQQRSLAEELGAMTSLLSDIDTLSTRARGLGERHRGYGVRAAHYRVARTVMTMTLHEVLGDQFGPAEEDAWNRATSLITELMQAS
jgi:hemoglobin-like flavoprotein